MNDLWAALCLLAAVVCGFLAWLGFFFTILSLLGFPSKESIIGFVMLGTSTVAAAVAALYLLEIAMELAVL